MQRSPAQPRKSLTLSSAGAGLSFEEAAMPNRVRINLVNPAELLELPGIGPEQAGAILRFRAEHGPIKDPEDLVKILGVADRPGHFGALGLRSGRQHRFRNAARLVLSALPVAASLQ